MRITLLGLLVVAGTVLLVIYVVRVYQETNQANANTGPGDSGFPNDPNSSGILPV